MDMATGDEYSAGELDAMLAVLHRLAGEYEHMQADVDAQACEHLGAGRRLDEVIAEMSRRSEQLRASNKPLVDELNATLRSICETYLQAPCELRMHIRDAFSGQKMLLVHLINLTGTACLAIPQGEAKYWLRTALAAISIEDNRTDPRDTHVALQYLLSSAEKAGIAPKAYLEEAAALSSDAMRGFLLGFAQRYP